MLSTFHASSIDLCIVLQCKLCIYILYDVLWKLSCINVDSDRQANTNAGADNRRMAVLGVQVVIIIIVIIYY